MKKAPIILLAIVGVTLIGCNLFGAKGYKSSEYLSTTSVAEPGQETRIELEDGAAMIIPAESIEQKITVKIERNPDKASSLPPFDDAIVQLGDFYSFEVVEGTLMGPVDLVIPFDESRIPDQDGFLTVAYPSQNGWNFIPVTAEGNQVKLYTTELGDPLIAWHFANPVWDDEAREKLAEGNVNYCEPYFSVAVFPENGNWDTEFRIVGSVESNEEIINRISKKGVSVSNVPVEIKFNYWVKSNTVTDTLRGQTDENGRFAFVFHPQKDTTLGLKEGLNGIQATAECDSPSGYFSSESRGWYNFKIETPEPIVEAATQEPSVVIPEPSPVPPGARAVPNVVGMTFEEARKTLKTLGFGMTWIDGSSQQELGTIYQQQPAAGTYKVPHRTTVVIYRTTEQITGPSLERILSPDFYARYECTSAVRYSNGKFKEGCPDNSTREYLYSGNNVVLRREDKESVMGSLTFSDSYYEPSSFDLWLPLDGAVYQGDPTDWTGDDGSFSRCAAYEFAPSSQSSSLFNGKEIKVQTYGYEKDCTDRFAYIDGITFVDETFVVTITASYDLSTGILVHAEKNIQWTSCTTTAPQDPGYRSFHEECAAKLSGKQILFVYDLVETSLNIGQP